MKGDVKRNNSPMAGEADSVCRGSQPLYHYRKPLFRQSAVKSCILIRRSFRKLNSIRGGMCRPWIYLRLEGYRCFRSCEGG